MESKKFTVWHAVLLFLVANAISAIPAGIYGEEVFYNSFQQPAIAPPDWLFAPVWFFLNVTSLWALYIVANLPRNTPGRLAFIRLEAAGWVLFSAFALVYFGLKSPILGAADTVAGLVVVGYSVLVGFRVEAKAGWLVLPRLLWLLLAAYVSVYVAVNNKDAFFGFG
jgi:tryptophan-rich sensory protein